MTTDNSSVKRIDELIATGHGSAAVAELRALLDQNPSDARLLHKLGEAYTKSGHLSEAGNTYINLIRLYPESPDAYFRFSEILLHLNRQKDALACLTRHLKVQPASDETITRMADILVTMNETEKALKFYAQAAALNPSNSHNYYAQARLFMETGDPDSAEKCLRDLLNQNPDHADALNFLGNIAYSRSRMKDAGVYYTKALDADRQHVDAEINRRLVSLPVTGSRHTLFLGLPKGENYGWGICSHYLTQELSRKTSVFSLQYKDWEANRDKQLPGPYFFALQDIHLSTPYKANGRFNCGYTFFENELSSKAVENAQAYDLVLAGSNWCIDRLNEKGITRTGLLIQGVDPERFFPVAAPGRRDNFVIFSGGKFELRKGQDLVLKAIKILQQRYDDIHLINIWYNMWPQSAATMSRSSHIIYEHKGETWTEQMEHLFHINGMDAARITTYELYPNEQLRALFARTDLGVFPNRCEGGTNLVLMEYMACGKPVVASNATGHTDILTPENALLLNKFKELEMRDKEGQLSARWVDPSLDELIALIEYAYHHREDIQHLGTQAGEDLKGYSWENSADQLLKTLPK